MLVTCIYFFLLSVVLKYITTAAVLQSVRALYRIPKVGCSNPSRDRLKYAKDEIIILLIKYERH